MQNSIFIHAAILNNTNHRISQYLDIIYNSNLIENIDYIFICFVGSDDITFNKELYKYNEKIIIKRVSMNLSDYEIPTLNELYNYCAKNSENNVLYLHTKNVGKEINICIEDQIKYMLHFNINKWKNCINILKKYNTCGVDLRNEPTLHYSGNMWWSRASYINTLPSPIEFNNLEKYPNPLNSIRHNQEFWICYYKDIEYHYSIWDCNISVYERHLHRYEEDKYNK